MICCRLVLAGEFGWVIVEADGHGGFFCAERGVVVVVVGGGGRNASQKDTALPRERNPRRGILPVNTLICYDVSV